MIQSNWAWLSIVGMMLPAAGLADDEESRSTGVPGLPTATPVISPTVEKWSAAPEHLFGRRPIPQLESIDRADAPRSIGDLYFRDGSALKRMSRLRSLSLVTLAEPGRTRLYFGVNEDGVVGLHIKALQQDDQERQLELVRLSYLEDDDPEGAERRPDDN